MDDQNIALCDASSQRLFYDMDVIFCITFYALRHDNELFSFSVSGWFLAHGTSYISFNSYHCHVILYTQWRLHAKVGLGPVGSA